MAVVAALQLRSPACRRRTLVRRNGTRLAAVSRSANGSVKQILAELVKNDAFRTHTGATQ